MTDEELTRLRTQHDNSRESTLVLLRETDEVLEEAQKVISSARKRLQKATEKYEERLHGRQASG